MSSPLARSRSLLALVAPVAIIGASSPPAHAAGLYFSDGGVRPLSRGGAFVAGADDLGATRYNPAGLADAGTSFMLDASLLDFRSSFTRQTQVADASGALHTSTSPTVHGSSAPLPNPSLGFSLALGKEKRWTLAFAAYAPYAAIASYPTTVNGQPSPARYSLTSLDGSLLIVPGVYAAYKPIEQVRIGVGLQAMVGSLDVSQTLSANPSTRVLSSAEDPTYDAQSQLKAGPIFAPSGTAGITIVPSEHLRIGASYQLPFVINTPATVDVRLPNAAEFDNAYQSGDKANVRFELPPVLRAGVEVRTRIAGRHLLRVEVAFKREFWTVEHSIDITPENIKLYNITAFPSPYAIGPITLPRNFDNANEYSLGGELTIGRSLDVRAGVSYDQSAIPAAYLSPLTIDLNRLTTAIGAGVHLGDHWRIDATYAHVFAFSQNVDPAIAAIQRVTPVQGNPAPGEAINGGMYTASADIFGLGFNYRF